MLLASFWCLHYTLWTNPAHISSALLMISNIFTFEAYSKCIKYIINQKSTYFNLVWFSFLFLIVKQPWFSDEAFCCPVKALTGQISYITKKSNYLKKKKNTSFFIDIQISFFKTSTTKQHWCNYLCLSDIDILPPTFPLEPRNFGDSGITLKLVRKILVLKLTKLFVLIKTRGDLKWTAHIHIMSLSKLECF